MIRRITVIIALVCVLGPAAFIAQTAADNAFTGEQYKKALWMVTRFYGAQRMGEGPNWLLMEHTHSTLGPLTKSYLKDSDGAHNLVGGWFDCGDHVLFGQTFFFSAYMLAKAYETFPTGFHDLYHGFDYSDYMESKDWSIAGGKPDGIPDLLQELKYATDWIIKAAPNATTFYSQKGDQTTAHSQWVTAPFQTTLPNNQGGEATGTRSITKNPNDGVMATYAAGTLALMSKIYRKYDAEYADLCLQHARYAYAYASANRNNSVGSSHGGHYQAHKHPATVFNLAAAEMFRATGEEAFKNAITASNLQDHGWMFDYSNSHELVMIAVAQALPERKDVVLAQMKQWFIDKYTAPSRLNTQGASTYNSGWGEMRYPANFAFAAALYQHMAGSSSYDKFIYNQIDYILGKNPSNRSFLIGFGPAENIANEVTMPHHRNVLLNDENLSHTAKETRGIRIPERNKYFGYMVGGRINTANFRDNYQEYQASEGGLDYNAGLLGTLAYIVSKLAPADTAAPTVTPTTLQISTSSDPVNTAAFIIDTLRDAAIPLTLYAHVFDQDGKLITGIDCESIFWNNLMMPTLPIIPPPTHPTGCSYTVPNISNKPAIDVTYFFVGANRPSIQKNIVVTDEAASVKHSAMTAKYGFAVNQKRDAVTFTAAQNMAISEVSIYNIAGRKVFSQKRAAPSAQIRWNIASTPKGMYIAQVKMSNGAVVQRNVLIK